MIVRRKKSRHGQKSGSRGGAASVSAASPIAAVSAAKLKSSLAEAGISKAEFARRSGLPLSLINRFLTGKTRRAGVDQLAALANGLKCDPTALLSRRGSKDA